MNEGDENLEGVDAIARRLRWTRQAMGLSQVEFCRRVGISTNTWNQFEKAKNRISLDEAKKLWRTEQISLDWIYQGVIGSLPARLADPIRQLQAQPDAKDEDGRKRA